MVIGIIALCAAVPTIIGVNEATKGTQDHEQKRRDASRKQRSHLIVTCELTAASGRDREQIHGAKVVLRNGKMYLEKTIGKDSHPFTGLYHPHPILAPNNMSGMITTISQDPPMLNWVFVDCKTFEVRYGTKSDSEEHIVGPWDWTPDENNVTMEGWEGFLAVRIPEENAWKLYFDHNDNGCGLPRGTKGTHHCRIIGACVATALIGAASGLKWSKGVCRVEAVVPCSSGTPGVCRWYAEDKDQKMQMCRMTNEQLSPYFQWQKVPNQWMKEDMPLRAFWGGPTRDYSNLMQS